jgi:hypothetical protein
MKLELQVQSPIVPAALGGVKYFHRSSTFAGVMVAVFASHKNRTPGRDAVGDRRGRVPRSASLQ